jgi:hypothetical protein
MTKTKFLFPLAFALVTIASRLLGEERYDAILQAWSRHRFRRLPRRLSSLFHNHLSIQSEVATNAHIPSAIAFKSGS